LTEYFKFWIVDERTGKRRLTTYRLAGPASNTPL